MTPSGWIIAALVLCVAFLAGYWRRTVTERPVWEALCQVKVEEIRAEFALSRKDHEAAVTGRIEAMRTLMLETQRLRDRRDAERDQQLADIQLVLKTRLRFQP